MSTTHQFLGGTSFLPVGSIILWAGDHSSIPPGWLLCDGRAVKKNTYSKLFATISSYYNTGGEAGDEFRLPSLDDKYMRGGAPNALTISGSNNHTHNFATSWGTSASGGSHTHNISVLYNKTDTSHGHGGSANRDLGAIAYTNSGTSTVNSSNAATGTTNNPAIATHSHNFGVGSSSFDTLGHSHSASSSVSAGDHSHNATVNNTNITAPPNNTEQSHFKARPLIRAS